MNWRIFKRESDGWRYVGFVKADTRREALKLARKTAWTIKTGDKLMVIKSE